MNDDRAGARVFGGMALGCALLMLLHVAAYGAVLLFAGLTSMGDPSIVLFAPVVFLALMPFVQPAWAAVAALAMALAGRRPMALGIVVGSALTFVLGGACVGVTLLTFEYHP